jgi:gas vesicle protein
MGKGKAFVAGAIIGGIVGAAVALLTAPRTGRELREELGINLEKAREKGKELIDVMKSQAGDVLEKAGENVNWDGRWMELPLKKMGLDSAKAEQEDGRPHEKEEEEKQGYIELKIQRDPNS